MIGVNKGSSEMAKATIVGEVYNPFAETEDAGSGIAGIIIIMLILFAVAIAFFIKSSNKIKASNGAPLATGKDNVISFTIQNDLDESLHEPESLDEIKSEDSKDSNEKKFEEEKVPFLFFFTYQTKANYSIFFNKCI